MEFKEEFALVVNHKCEGTGDSDDDAQDESAHMVSPSCYRQYTSNAPQQRIGFFLRRESITYITTFNLLIAVDHEYQNWYTP
jgi:hypothetical protein